MNADKVVKFSGAGNDRLVLLDDYLKGDAGAVIPNVYSNADVNLNGKINYNNANNDKDVILLDGLGGNTDMVRYEQIPFCAIENEDVYPPMLCGLNEAVFKPVPYDDDPCKDLPKMAYTAAEEKWELYKDSINNVFDAAYYNKCMQAKNMESLKVTYANSEYHYTLYYYDQADNLVKTVPPAGVTAKHGDAVFLDQVTKARLTVKQGGLEQNNKVVPVHTLVTDSFPAESPQRRNVQSEGLCVVESKRKK